MEISKTLKIKLLIYTILSSFCFYYMILVNNASISVLLFSLIQLIFMYFVVPNKKRLLLFLPVLILSLGSFIRASNIWRVPNIAVYFIIMGCMFFNFNFKNDSLQQLSVIGSRLIAPFEYFHIPFKWIFRSSSDKSALIKRIVLALLIAVPCAATLAILLASADTVFSAGTSDFISKLSGLFNYKTFVKLNVSLIAGLYLSGILIMSYLKKNESEIPNSPHQGDLVIINIVLSTILFIYTLFVFIQFKYLFAGAALPDGLSYTDYARKGFFELLALTVVNIALIFAVIRLTKSFSGKWAVFSKILCIYLCAVTVVLLASSFYRMLLYTNDDGLTRLRLFVLVFLSFELLGLIATFVYIIKPKFNIILIYAVIALIYYLLLNIMPTDYIVAKNQIDKYLSGERRDLHYVFSLSADAVPAIEHLYENTDDESLKLHIRDFINNRASSRSDQWQSYNLSTQQAKHTAENLK